LKKIKWILYAILTVSGIAYLNIHGMLRRLGTEYMTQKPIVPQRRYYFPRRPTKTKIIMPIPTTTTTWWNPKRWSLFRRWQQPDKSIPEILNDVVANPIQGYAIVPILEEGVQQEIDYLLRGLVTRRNGNRALKNTLEYIKDNKQFTAQDNLIQWAQKNGNLVSLLSNEPSLLAQDTLLFKIMSLKKNDALINAFIQQEPEIYGKPAGYKCISYLLIKRHYETLIDPLRTLADRVYELHQKQRDEKYKTITEQTTPTTVE
jgi:hypothetical protein